MKKIVSLMLALVMCMTLCVPAFATEMDGFSVKEEVVNVQAKSSSELSTREPATPSGFSYWYSAKRNSNFDAAFNGVALVLTGFIPGLGVMSTVIGLTMTIAGAFDNSNLPAEYEDIIYQADNPEAEYGVPYVYWHKLKYTIEVPNGGTYIRWADYYEYAVAPR